ncbi:MAG TPA: sigma-70 family RNA polymerase sigma factor [Actinocrinis sp.]|nr:sigma-70 family RNA polymerase sigma factor [Actinocrinis sp.]
MDLPPQSPTESAAGATAAAAGPAAGSGPDAAADAGSGAAPEPSAMAGSGYIDQAFDAFVQSNFPLWIRYAHVQVGDRESAELIAGEIAIKLHEAWEQILNQRNVSSHTMDLLRGEIVRWRTEHAITDQTIANAAFERAVQAEPGGFAALSESLGAFGAIADLPERQHQAVVLRYVLGCDVVQAARLMGLSPKTVTSHTAQARRTLARELGIELGDPDGED